MRVFGVTAPIDGAALNLWREADYAQIARAFEREGMNPMLPRVDWRGATPGYAEMELPVVPWLGALVFTVTGFDTTVLRVICAFFSVAALLVFARLAAAALPPMGSLFATAFFAFTGGTDNQIGYIRNIAKLENVSCNNIIQVILPDLFPQITNPPFGTIQSLVTPDNAYIVPHTCPDLIPVMLNHDLFITRDRRATLPWRNLMLRNFGRGR